MRELYDMRKLYEELIDKRDLYDNKEAVWYEGAV